MVKVIPLKTRGRKQRCLMCDKPANKAFRPFCSKRCADLDLGKWLKESYRLSTDEEADLEGAPPEGGE